MTIAWFSTWHNIHRMITSRFAQPLLRETRYESHNSSSKEWTFNAKGRQVVMH